MIDRRSLIAATLATSAGVLPSLAKAAAEPGAKTFPPGFMWGAATAGHQIEGNNTNSDCWLMEAVSPTLFKERSGDAANSFAMWDKDLDTLKALGLNTYRFSLEWARIEPEEGQFSLAMLDHYKAMIAGCRQRDIFPVVTYNHYTCPRWFSTDGGWTNAASVDRFARFCDKVSRHLARDIGIAMTLNEPNMANILVEMLPPEMFALQHQMLMAAARATGSPKFSAVNATEPADVPIAMAHLIRAHHAGRAAIKAVRPDLKVGLSLSMFDDQADGDTAPRDAMREKLYGPWLRAVAQDDFLGVQNYERSVWSARGRVPAPADAVRSTLGTEVYAPSLANAVRYAHAATGRPILISEHGVNTDDDTIRARLIPQALGHLHQTMGEGVPVMGYIHWSLIDNFEWIFGYAPHYGLCSVEKPGFVRKPKPSATLYGAIARRNAV